MARGRAGREVANALPRSRASQHRASNRRRPARRTMRSSIRAPPLRVYRLPAAPPTRIAEPRRSNRAPRGCPPPRVRADRPGSAAVQRNCAAGSASGSDSSIENVDPAPGVLANSSLPPISSTSWRDIARPRPVPPKRRVVDASSWANSSNMRAWFSGAIPTPVSATSSRTLSGCQEVLSACACCNGRTRRMTSPRSVNFTRCRRD